MIAPLPALPPVTTQSGTLVQATAAGLGTGLGTARHAAPPSVLRSSTDVPFARRAVARHHRADGHVTDVKVCRPWGVVESSQRAPPSEECAAAAPLGPVPAATQSAGFAHDAAVATARAAGSVASDDHEAPLSTVLKTAVVMVAVTSARQRPGPVQAIAAMPDPGGCDAVVDATLCLGLTMTMIEPLGSEPPSRHPDDQHPAAVSVAPGRGGVAAGAHLARPPAETSIDAAPVVVVDVPAATHHARASHASAESATWAAIAW